MGLRLGMPCIYCAGPESVLQQMLLCWGGARISRSGQVWAVTACVTGLDSCGNCAAAAGEVASGSVGSAWLFRAAQQQGCSELHGRVER